MLLNDYLTEEKAKYVVNTIFKYNGFEQQVFHFKITNTIHILNLHLNVTLLFVKLQFKRLSL